jgi:imidazolonepropionase-like amidohydrolase
MGKVIQKELPLLITAQRVVDIMDALRIAKEFDIRIILDGAAESLSRPRPDQGREGAGDRPSDHGARGRRDGERVVRDAGALKKAGIPVALQSGYESYVPKTRLVLFEAAEAAANGLSFDEALALITIDAARILGIDKRVRIARGRQGRRRGDLRRRSLRVQLARDGRRRVTASSSAQ